MIDVSVIIVNYNTKDMTGECIKSVMEKTKGITFEIIMIDNASPDSSAEALLPLTKKYPLKIIANKDNKGFGGGNNQGLKIAQGNYLLLLNTDTLLKTNVIKDMIDWMEAHPKVGISSCALKNRDGTLQGTGGYFPTLFKVFAWMSFLEDIPGLDSLIKPFHPM